MLRLILLGMFLIPKPTLAQDSLQVQEIQGLNGYVNFIPNALVDAYKLDYLKSGWFLRSDIDEIKQWAEKDSLNLQLLRDGMAYRESRKKMLWISPLASVASFGLSYLMLSARSCDAGDPAEIEEDCSDLSRIAVGGAVGMVGLGFIFKGVSSLIFPSKQEAVLKNKWDLEHGTRHLSHHYEFGWSVGIWKGAGGMEKFGYQTLRGIYFGIGHLPWSFQGEMLLHSGPSNDEYGIWDGAKAGKSKRFTGGMVTANMEYFPFIKQRMALGYGLGIGYQGWRTMDEIVVVSLEKSGLEPEAGVGGLSLYVSQEFIFWNNEWVNARVSTRLGYPFIASKVGETLGGPNLSLYLKLGLSVKDRRGL